MLQLRDISYAAGGKEILKHIDLDIHERFVAITGPNGSGKSTLAKLIMGIEHPAGGKHSFGRGGYHRLVHHQTCTTRRQLCFSAAGFASRGSPCVI